MASYYQRVKRTSGYTIMSNYHLRDMNLSLKASGLLSLVLSLPEDWQYSVKGLTAIVKEGESAVKSALQELEQHGYLRRTEIRTESGKFQGLEYIFLEYPGRSAEPKRTGTDDPKYAEKNGTENANWHTKWLG